jgi:hypothetical protein
MRRARYLAVLFHAVADPATQVHHGAMRKEKCLASLLCLLALFVAAESWAGAPLKGVDVKLGKNPGGSPEYRTTNGNGVADFGVLPKGAYYMTFAGGDGSTNQSPAIAEIEIKGAEGGPVKAHWDLKQGRRFDPASGSTSRKAGDDRIIITSDGKNPVSVTIVRSKSNITNN